MNFGVPTQRKKREEKYPDTAVFTVGINEGKGKSRAMIFNAKALETLGIVDKKAHVVFSFPGDGSILIGNADQPQIPDDFAIRLTKGNPRKASDKKTYEYISKILDLDNTVENEFEVIAFNNPIANQPTMFKIQTMQAASTTASTTDEVKDAAPTSFIPDVTDAPNATVDSGFSA